MRQKSFWQLTVAIAIPDRQIWRGADRGGLRDAKVRNALRLLFGDVYPLHRGAPRPLARELHHRVNSIAGTLERGLHAAVRVVPDPARDPTRLRHPPSRIAKEHALDLAVDDDPLADHV